MLKIIIATDKPRFPLGILLSTPGASELLTPEEIGTIITRHSRGDWGEVCPEDAKENELGLQEGFRLLSVYTIREQRIWVITEADRSATTILLPEEY